MAMMAHVYFNVVNSKLQAMVQLSQVETEAGHEYLSNGSSVQWSEQRLREVTSLHAQGNVTYLQVAWKQFWTWKALMIIVDIITYLVFMY